MRAKMNSLSKHMRSRYIMLGGLYSVENEARFEKVYLHVSNDGRCFSGKHYGLYGCFTVMTQHTYGTKDELLFILGVMSTHKDNMETDTHEFYKSWNDVREISYMLAAEDTLDEMKRIGELEGINVEAETYREAYDKYFDNETNHTSKFLAGNYFYWYRIGKALLHECEIVSGIMKLEA